MIILLCGFMGSGKSSLLERVKNHYIKEKDQTAFIFKDLDQVVLNWTNKSNVQEITNEYGWEYFRKIEKKALISLCQEVDNAVISLGGGTLDSEILEFIDSSKHEIKVIWVDTPFENCMDRIIEGGVNLRPLLSVGREKLLNLYNERKKMYLTSNMVLSVNAQSKVDSLNDLLRVISN